MTLALVIPGPLDRRSGGYSYDTDLVAALREVGVTVRIWSLDGALDSWPGTADVIIVDALAHPLVIDLLERAKPTFKTVALVHHPAWLEEPPGSPFESAKKDLEARFLRLVDAWLFNSEDTKTSVAALLSPEPHASAEFRPWHLCRPPLKAAPADSRSIRTERAPGAPFSLLFLANVTPRKNLLGLLSALDVLSRDQPQLDWRLTVAGSLETDAGYVSLCRDHVAAAGLGSRVTWLGWLAATELERVWEATDLLTVPSFHEGWGMVYAEAMARGIPSLAASRGGAAEAIGHAGLLADPLDAVALAAQLARWMLDAQLRDELALRCRQRAAWLVASGSGFGGLADFLGDLMTLPSKPLPPRTIDWNAWLEAKAQVDNRSLHPRIRRAAFAGAAPARVLELGGGSGTMARRLISEGALQRDTHYTLVDQSAGAVALAQQTCTPLFDSGCFEPLVADLYRYLDAPAAGSPPDLVIAHALLDLLDPGRAATALASLGARRLWLTHLFDGLTEFVPQLDAALDAQISRCYHQTMDERARSGGEGSSRAGRQWLEALTAAGLTVVDAAASDWVVLPTPENAQFVTLLLEFFRSSLTGKPELDPSALEWWLHVREAQARRGQLGVVVHQLDLLAQRSFP